ncbi:hypothetical protein AB0910_10695 [Streptomyces sp. NPDC047002]|uniref:hypothetical protein n=1 Tax=Streptomyces sp. NPDC047002 TaxID=3155475 RepID=UPI0034565211
MNTGLLEALSPQRQADVQAAVYAVETSMLPVPASGYRALAETPLRMVVESMLASAGRTLLAVGPGYLSGYDDKIRGRLVREGLGVLPVEDRAVLTLVVLFSVVIPRASGAVLPGTLWTQGEPVRKERLREAAVSDGVLDAALRRLADADLVRSGRPGLLLGHQFLRLTPRIETRLFEELVLLADPHGALAESIQRRREGPGEVRSNGREASGG